MTRYSDSSRGVFRQTCPANSNEAPQKHDLQDHKEWSAESDIPRPRMSKGPVSKPTRSQKKRAIPLSERAALSPEEFAAQFGKQKIWTYRQIYAGRIKAITGFGNTMIPRTEVERILSSAVVEETEIEKTN